jgi:3-oxoacid CoA-transferase subunit B
MQNGARLTSRRVFKNAAQAEAFAMISGGHIDISILGALEVSEAGDLPNWFVPWRRVGRIGGAMYLVSGVKKVIVIMNHVTRDGRVKIVNPLTGKKIVGTIVTDLAFCEITEEGLLLKEIAPGFTVEEIQSLTDPQFKVSKDLKEMEV